ncbi:polyphosphate kinase [Rhabdobacter roseus]|uniref:Polyphosphate kinase n=1 Tax=Rhabdobacter roseus TaxID=1655419 RepID=A0A840TUZ8_9BACT|nr:polyphosphate kinase 1 [Rhabdobacter roseus]MBB5283499.1 polyphosphate kinase [Rhabdobacter roseus]
MIDVSHPYFDTNLSWLSYNYRLLLEAKDESVPPRERLRFLALYSYHIDEFYRVRIPTLMAMKEVGPDILEKLNLYPEPLLEHIQETVDNQLSEFGDILSNRVLPDLAASGVHLYFKENFIPEHQDFVRKYFVDKVFRYLQPVFLNGRKSTKVTFFEPNRLYFVVRLLRRNDPREVWYAYVNIPSAQLSRFVELPEHGGQKQVAFLDDIVRYNLSILFPGYETIDCFAVRAERDTELSIEDDYPATMAQRINKQLEKRNFVQPHQFFCEMGMPLEMREYLSGRVGILMNEFHERGRYLYCQDLADFPSLHRKLDYPVQKAIGHVELREGESIFDALQKSDQLLHLPYHSFDPVVRFFNEAAVDPFVREIFVSLYKISANSFIVNSLISAARNGKRVVTFVDLNPKYDIQENLQWAKKMKEAGVKIIFSIPGLKVHAKIALVKRKVKKGWERYAYLGTGGFHRLTSREFVDHALLTSHRELTNELELLFGYLCTREDPKKYRYLPFNYLHVSQFNGTRKIIELIDREIKNSKAGLKATISIKINQLQDQVLISKLYQAGRAGVEVNIIVSDCCCLIPELPTISDNITVTRLVDRYLENTRIFYFSNRGKEEIYLSSGDWTYRNFHRRIDVGYPILDDYLKSQMKQVLKNYLNDNQKAVRLDTYQHNVQLHSEQPAPKVRAQEANYRLAERLEHRTPSLFQPAASEEALPDPVKVP